MIRIRKELLYSYLVVFLIFWTSGSVSGFMLHSSVLVLTFVAVSFFYFKKTKKSIEKNAFFAYLLYLGWLLVSYFFVGSHNPVDKSIFIVYMLLVTGALLSLQSIEYDKFRYIYLNIAFVIAVTSLVLFFLHLNGLIPVTKVCKPGSTIPYMMFAFNNFGWLNSFGRLAGPYWEPGAFQIVLNYAVLMYIDDVSKFAIDRKKMFKLLIIIVAVLMTKSTTGSLFLVLVAIVTMANSKVKKSNFFKMVCLGIAAFFACCAIASSDAVQKKFEQKGVEGMSYEIRMTDNIAMMKMTVEKPFCGYGIVSNEFRARGKVLGNVTSSNGLLAITSQMGIPFFVVFVYMIYRSVRRLFPKRSLLFLLLILLLNSSEVFFYFPIFFIFLFIRKKKDVLEL